MLSPCNHVIEKVKPTSRSHLLAMLEYSAIVRYCSQDLQEPEKRNKGVKEGHKNMVVLSTFSALSLFQIADRTISLLTLQLHPLTSRGSTSFPPGASCP